MKSVLFLAPETAKELNDLVHATADIPLETMVAGDNICVRQWIVYPDEAPELTLVFRLMRSWPTPSPAPGRHPHFLEMAVLDTKTSKQLAVVQKNWVGKNEAVGCWSATYSLCSAPREVTLEIIPLSAARVVDALRNAVTDIRDNWSGGYDDVVSATSLTRFELKMLNFTDAEEGGEDHE